MIDLSDEVKTEVIRYCVKRCEHEFDDTVYNECLEAVKNASLKDAPRQKPTMRRFLYKWGRMGRVLGRAKYQNWENRLAEKIESNRKELETLRMKELERVSLDRYESVIKKCYGSFKDAVGPIAAVKVLHLICPSFFPLWDNGIANAVRKEHEDMRDDEFSASDYFRFMEKIQEFIKDYEQLLSELSTKPKKGKLRIVDRLLWWIVHRPLSLWKSQKK